jgi:hypothetical protein
MTSEVETGKLFVSVTLSLFAGAVPEIMIVGPGVQEVEHDAVWQKPHIGTVLPSGSVVVILCAVNAAEGLA